MTSEFSQGKKRNNWISWTEKKDVAGLCEEIFLPLREKRKCDKILLQLNFKARKDHQVWFHMLHSPGGSGMAISVSSLYHALKEQPIFHKAMGGTTVALLCGLCMLQKSAWALCPLSRDSTKPGIPMAWPSALPNQVFFPQRASRSLWGVWRSRAMKANEEKYNHGTPSHSQAAQSRFWRWAVICLPNWLKLAHLSPTEMFMIWVP